MKNTNKYGNKSIIVSICLVCLSLEGGCCLHDGNNSVQKSDSEASVKDGEQHELMMLMSQAKEMEIKISKSDKGGSDKIRLDYAAMLQYVVLKKNDNNKDQYSDLTDERKISKIMGEPVHKYEYTDEKTLYEYEFKNKENEVIIVSLLFLKTHLVEVGWNIKH